MNPVESLRIFLDGNENVNDETFTINDEQTANWALRKIARFQEQIKSNNELAVAEISKIEEWNKAENEKALGSIDYFQGLLAQYALSIRNDDPKFKSKKLPNGRIRFVKQQPAWKYDDGKVVEQLEEMNMPDLIAVKKSPNKREIKKRFKVFGESVMNPETGEIIGGINIEEREDKFEVIVDE